MKKTKKSIVLVSGGLDSAVTAAIAALTTEPAFLHVNYGQRTERRELKAFERLAAYYKVRRTLVADIRHLSKIGCSALTDLQIQVPKGRLYRKNIPVTYVPFRNAHILSIATAWAEAINASEIYIGAVEEDSSGYPDCREEFFKAFEKAVRLGTATKRPIKIKTPLIHRRKSWIVKTGLRLKAPLHLTWSCYKESRLACGACDSCLLRLRGFKEAGVEDPIPYKKLKQGEAR
ncbi:MAG: 7-cyano-7-deazaguanine synthase QueC [Deltaproteobacteria bacterium]|nr:7-cyano-7-deazaguanine synthase QueC [Deltaproteobacteria bacterium]